MIPPKLRLGMVGGGRGAFIGGVHRMAARLDDRYELVAGVFSSDSQRSRDSGADLRLAPERCYATLDDMLRIERDRADRIDVVAIVTPNHLHHLAARQCLAAGFHVICDKPLTTSLADAEDLVRLVEATQRVFAVTYNYSGYPLVRQAREMVANGELGDIRVVQAEYAQDWLATPLEASGNKQAQWRVDPERSGVAGAIGDIGTHAFHLTEFVTGTRVTQLAADLSSQVPGRRLDDNGQVLMRFSNGARGALWASQVAAGNENGLRLRVYGSKAGLEWSQEMPNELRFAPVNGQPRLLTRGGSGLGAAAKAAMRVPSGHPEGYIEAFAQIYSDAAVLIIAAKAGTAASGHASLVPTVGDGMRGVQFIHAVVESNERNAAWISI
jgi:predicted dehydrogenase